MKADQVKGLLRSIKEGTDAVALPDQELIDTLSEIIKVEKRHLYGLDSTSAKKRRDEVFDVLEKHYKKQKKV